MFSDPITVTTQVTGARVCPRTAMGTSEASYTSPTGDVNVRISHTTSKSRTRRLVRVDVVQNIVEIASGVAKPVQTSAYLVIDFPSSKTHSVTGISQANLAADLMTWLAAADNANLNKVVASEY